MRYYWYIASIPAINTWFPTGAPTFSTSIPLSLKFGYPQIRHCDASCSAKSRGWVDLPKHQFSGKFRGLVKNPKTPIFRKICHFRKFLNRQISVKIRGFVRNFRKIWDFWHNYMMYWINSGYKCRVSDKGAHFFDRHPVLCNNALLLQKLVYESIFFA